MQKKYTGKNCIVTGGAGFIGQSLVQALINQKANVYVIENFLFGSSKKLVHKEAVLIIGDVRDKETFEKKLPKIKYDYLFHFAAPSSIILFNEDSALCTDITIQGFLNALLFSKKNAIKFIYPSSGSLYAGIEPPHNEKKPLNVSSLNNYAKNKKILEQIAEIFSNEIQTLGVRIFAGYGPGEIHKGRFASVIYSFCDQILHGVRPVIWGDGTQVRDFIFIDDIASIILDLAPSCKEKIINIGSGSSTSFNDIIALINNFAPKKILPKYIPKPSVYLEKTQADITLLKKYYTRSFTSLELGIQKIIDSIK